MIEFENYKEAYSQEETEELIQKLKIYVKDLIRKKDSKTNIKIDELRKKLNIIEKNKKI